MNEIIHTAVLGLGRAGLTHVPALQAHRRFALLGLHSSRSGQAAEVAAARKIPRVYDDWRQAVTDPEISLVVIASAPGLRAEQVRMAMANDKHVLVEPPIADHPRELDDLLQEAARLGHAAAACLTYRYHPARQALRELVINGHLGAVRSASWRHLGARWDRALVVHALDALHWTLGGMERESCARMHAEGVTLIQARHFRGCVSQVAVDGGAATAELTFTISGSERAALAAGDDPDAAELHVIEGQTDDEYRLRPSPYQRFAAAGPHVPALMELLDDLAAAIDGSASEVPTLADAAEAQHLAG